MFVTSIRTNYIYPPKSSDNCLSKRRIFAQFSKFYFVIRIIFWNEKFFTSQIFCVVNTQQRNVRQYVIFYKEGWVKRSRLSNLWGAACKVLTNIAIEHIWSRSSTSQFVFVTFPKLFKYKPANSNYILITKVFFRCNALNYNWSLMSTWNISLPL